MSRKNPDTQRQPCAQPGCERSFPVHKWGQITAHREGWFHQKDGTSWCPEHVPDWVEKWRARKG